PHRQGVRRADPGPGGGHRAALGSERRGHRRGDPPRRGAEGGRPRAPPRPRGGPGDRQRRGAGGAGAGRGAARPRRDRSHPRCGGARDGPRPRAEGHAMRPAATSARPAVPHLAAGALTVALVAIAARPAQGADARRLPERPQALVATAWPAATGRTVTVPAGGDLQAALDWAAPGDVIALAPGAAFTGPFTLPKKSGNGWIVVRTATRDEA